MGSPLTHSVQELLKNNETLFANCISDTKLWASLMLNSIICWLYDYGIDLRGHLLWFLLCVMTAFQSNNLTWLSVFIFSRRLVSAQRGKFSQLCQSGQKVFLKLFLSLLQHNHNKFNSLYLNILIYLIIPESFILLVIMSGIITGKIKIWPLFPHVPLCSN